MESLPLFKGLTTKRLLYGLLALALVVHLLSNVFMFMYRPEAISTTPDPLDYRLAALNLLDHQTFSLVPPSFETPQLLRTPPYPALVAAGYLLDGRTGLAIIIFQSFLLVAMGWMLFKLMGAFHIPEKIALVLTAFYLFEPLQWLYTLHTMTETLTSFIVLALLTGAFVGKGIVKWWHAALYGIGLGLLIFIKPSAVMWAPFLLIPLLLVQDPASRAWRGRFLRVLIASFFMFLTLLPWMLRNEALVGKPIISSSDVFNFILFAGTPDTVPEEYWKVQMVATYNDRTNQVWYAYTAPAYPMLLETKERILATLDYEWVIERQLSCVPQVWYGNTYGDEHGHEYDLIASFVLGPNATRTTVLSFLDVVIWSVILGLMLLGFVALLGNAALRWRYFPLLVILLSTLLINFCASWVRMLLPVYPAIFIAVGAGITFGIDRFIRKSRM